MLSAWYNACHMGHTQEMVVKKIKKWSNFKNLECIIKYL